MGDKIIPAEQVPDGRHICCMPAYIGDTVLSPYQVYKLFLQFTMKWPFTGSDTACRDRCPIILYCLLGGLGNKWVSAQPEVIVAGVVDELPSFYSSNMIVDPLIYFEIGICNAAVLQLSE